MHIKNLWSISVILKKSTYTFMSPTQHDFKQTMDLN